MLYAGLPRDRRPGAASAAGFGLAETWWPGEPVDEWREAVRASGLAIELINAEAGDVAAGERGFLNVAALRDRELERVRAAVALAASVGAPRVNVLVGRSVPGVREGRQRAAVISALREAAAGAIQAGITLVVEPINTSDVPGYLVGDATAGYALIDAVGSPAVRLLYDAYHAARAGADPVREVAAFIDVIDHVQYADCPGRGAPGSGEIALAELVGALTAAGYRGAIGLEFDPGGDAVAPPS